MKLNEITLGKSKESQWLGVCRGLADHFQVDPILFRLLFLVLFFCLGQGFWIYWLLWVVMPYHPSDLDK